MEEERRPGVGKIFEIRTPDIPYGAYLIAIFTPSAITFYGESGVSVDISKGQPIFKSETLAEDWLFLPIIKNYLGKGAWLGLLLNPDDPFDPGLSNIKDDGEW